jgi:hypothetical protein
LVSVWQGLKVVRVKVVRVMVVRVKVVRVKVCLQPPSSSSLSASPFWHVPVSFCRSGVSGPGQQLSKTKR